MSLEEKLKPKTLALSFSQKTTATTVALSSSITVSELCCQIDVCSAQIHTGRLARIKSIKLLYLLFAKISTDSEALIQLEIAFRDLGDWRTSRKLLNALVQKGLGVDRKLASKYSKVILHALESGIPESAFEHFVTEHGGIEAISRIPRKSVPAPPTVPTPQISRPSPVNPIGESDTQGASRRNAEFRFWFQPTKNYWIENTFLMFWRCSNFTGTARTGMHSCDV